MLEMKSRFPKLFRSAEPVSTTSPDTLQLTRSELLALRHPATLLVNQKPRQIRSAQAGSYLSRFRGRGSEFDEYRPYQPGDEIRDIDWRVSARSGRTYTKLFREERECPILLALDLRRPMHFGSRTTFKSLQAIRAAVLLAWLGEHRGDRVGLSLFNESGHHELRPKRGQKAVLHLINHLLDHQTPSQTEKPETLEKELLRLQAIAKTGSRIYLLSDFHDLDDLAIQRLRGLARHSEVVCLFCYDPLESQLPDHGTYTVTNGKQRLTLVSDKNIASDFQQRFAQRQQTLQELAQTNAIKLLPIATNDQLVDKLRGLTQ